MQFYNKLAQISMQGKTTGPLLFTMKNVYRKQQLQLKQQISSNQRMIAVCYVGLGEYDNARKYLLTALPQPLKEIILKPK